MPEPLDVEAIQARLRDFAQRRDWEQFHTPKNLAMALAGEVGELLEIFQWLTPEESAQVGDGSSRSHVEEEVADVLIYLLRLSDLLDIDLGVAVEAKLAANEQRYPTHLAHGTAKKYDQL